MNMSIAKTTALVTPTLNAALFSRILSKKEKAYTLNFVLRFVGGKFGNLQLHETECRVLPLNFEPPTQT